MQDKQRWLCFRFVGWFFLCNAALFLLFGFGYLQSMVSSHTLFKNLIFEYANWYGKTWVLLFIFATYFSYICLLAYIPSSFVLISVLFFPNKKFTTVFAILCAYISLLLITLDSRLYAMYKFHLNIPILQMLFSTDIRDLLDLSLREEITIILVISLILTFLIISSIFVWKRIIPRRLLFGKYIIIIWFGAVLFSYFTLMLSITMQHNNLLIQQAATLPYYNQILALIIPQKNANNLLNRYSEGSYMQAKFAGDKLNYPKKVMQCRKLTNQSYNIILIMVDSLRLDSLRYMPNTKKFSQQSWDFLNHYSGGNATQSGLFTLFYSIPSSYWSAALDQKTKPVFIDLILKNNYITKVIWSSEMHNPPMYKTIYNGLKNLNLDAVNSKNLSEWDKTSTTAAINFLQSIKTNNRPFFLNIFYNAPHAFCRSQDFPKKYLPISQECSRINMQNNSDPSPFYNSYLNTVDFIDKEIHKLLDMIAKKSLLDNSIVIITSDHGQEFNENHLNYWGHASNYSRYQVQVPLIIHWPGEAAHEFNHITTHYDVMPTIISRVFNCKNTIDDYSIGDDLLNINKKQDIILSGSYANMGIIEKDRLTTMHVSGEITVTDLNMRPIVNAEPRKSALKKSFYLMREYYSKHSGQTP